MVRRSATGLPFEIGDRGALAPQRRPRSGLVHSCDRALARLRPQLFAYQFIYELKA